MRGGELLKSDKNTIINFVNELKTNIEKMPVEPEVNNTNVEPVVNNTEEGNTEEGNTEKDEPVVTELKSVSGGRKKSQKRKQRKNRKSQRRQKRR